MGYLHVGYELVKLDDNKTLKGEFMPMGADDGPHYGDMSSSSTGQIQTHRYHLPARAPIWQACGQGNGRGSMVQTLQASTMNSFMPEPERRRVLMNKSALVGILAALSALARHRKYMPPTSPLQRIEMNDGVITPRGSRCRRKQGSRSS